MSIGTAESLVQQPPEPPNPFPYGWRYQFETLPGGGDRMIQVPLTLRDALYPKEGDVIPENSVHSLDRTHLSQVARARLRSDPTALVLSDTIVDWGVEGLGNHSPDVSAFTGVAHAERDWGTFPMKEEGARCIMAVEIVSPNTRVNDVQRKIEDYHTARVPLYILIDQKRLGGPRTLHGHRWTPDGFVDLDLDDQGRLFIEPLGVLLGLRDGRLVCFDAETGAEWKDYPELAEDLEETKQRLQTQESAARESQTQAAEALRQLRAQQAVARDAEARAAEAEQLRQAQQTAACDAEARAAEAERRLRELEAEMRRLRGET